MTPEHVVHLIDEAFKKKATFLDLGNCALTDIPVELEVLAPFLKELNLGPHYWKNQIYIESKNKHSENDFSSFLVSTYPLEALLKLTKLYIAKTGLKYSFKKFSFPVQIRVLDVSSNNIGDLYMAPLLKLTNLISLNISGNELRETGAKCISNLINLKTLNVGNNKIDKRGAEHIAKLEKLTFLEIGSNEVEDDGLIHLSELSNLDYLGVTGNNITALGTKNISNLTKLTSLKIGFANNIGDSGAKNISSLAQLVDLDVFNSGVTNIGTEHLSKLINLTSLNVSNNKIGDYGAKLLSKLTNLSKLSIYFTGLSDAGVKFLSKLTNIVSLHVGHNSIKELDSIRLLILELPRLNTFHFDNYITHNAGLDQEISGNLQTLKAYFASTYKVKNTLVKMILMGNTTAGKSSLADFLANGNYEGNRKSTHGIHLWRWKAGKEENDLQINIWDFGGQDYYHATHNLFLGDKTLFLLLHPSKTTHLSQQDTDETQNLSVNYWLGNIRSITNEASKIWYIQSKADDEQLDYLPTESMQRYGVSRQYKISVMKAAEKDSACEDDFNYFHKKLLDELIGLAKGELPVSWVAIRDQHLPKWRKKNLYISEEEFKIKCEDALKNNSNISNDLKVSWNGLLPYLKSCGEVVQFEKAGLADKIFLSAEALTKGIYHVLSRKVFENNGEFTLTDLKEVDKVNGEVYLDVLKSFEIIFKKANEIGVYVAPQYLPENPYTQYFQELIKVAYIIRFPDYMSRSLITRFLVKYGGSSEKNYFWKYGAFFTLHEVKVFVRIDTEEQKVYIHAGDEKQKFTVIKELFLFFTLPTNAYFEPEPYEVPSVPELAKRGIISGAQARELTTEELKKKVPDEVELSLNDVDFACVKDIRDAIDIKAYKIKSMQGGIIEFNATIHQLLNTNAIMPKKIFLSYSHKDEAYKIELDNHFAALKRSGKIETWHDRKILAGEGWDKSIQDALLNADIALLLLSPDFMASDYIWNVEIPKAIQNGVYIVPIFVRSCDFKESVFNLYEKQGLPSDAKPIVSSNFQYRDEAYLQVVEGIKKLL